MGSRPVGLGLGKIGTPRAETIGITDSCYRLRQKAGQGDWASRLGSIQQIRGNRQVRDLVAGLVVDLAADLLGNVGTKSGASGKP